MRQQIRPYMLPALLLGALSIGSCSDEFATPDGNTILNATLIAPEEGTGAESRTAVDPTDYASGQIGINWLPDDKIGVYGDKGTANTCFTNTKSSETAETEFKGNLTSDEKALYAYYPYSETAGNDYKSLSGNLPLTQNYSTTTRSLEGDWKVGEPADASNTHFKFSHLFALLRFEVNAAGSSIAGETLESIALTIPGKQLGGDFTYNFVTKDLKLTPASDASTLTMKWSDTPTLSSGTFLGYMSCAPVDGIAGKPMDIVVTTSRHTAKFTVNLKASSLEANKYYTLPLTLSNFADSWQLEERKDVTREDAAWVPGLQSKLACANTVFAVPGTPFMHKIRTADASQTIEAYNLPEGLTWNARRRLVEGKIANEGEYTYSVEVRNADGSTAFTEGIRLTVSNSLHQPTPHMGWQSWNVLETKIDETSLKAVADALVSNGWKDAGYIWLGIDDCWQQLDGARESDGTPKVNKSKFPNGLKSLTDYIHSKGLKAGIYSDAGTVTCASGGQAGGTTVGAYNYEAVTAKAFTEWGFDKLKEDWFWGGHGDANGNLDPSSTPLARELYMRMGNGIKANGNKILLSMCEWGIHEPWKWGPEAGASSWRMSYDHRDGWMGTRGSGQNSPTQNDGGIGLRNTIDLMRNLWPYVGVNRFNDADMLVVGIRGKGTSSNDLVYGNKGMSDAEYETEFAMWCMWGSPLLLTLDVRSNSINSHDEALLKNKELIAINQDPMGQGAEFIKSVGNLDYYCKDLANGDVAIAVVNLGTSTANYTITLSDYDALDATKTYTLRDCIERDDEGTLSSGSPKTGSLKSHATVVYRLKAK